MFELAFVFCCCFNKILMLWFSFLLGGKETSLCGNVFIGRRLGYLLCILCYTFGLSSHSVSFTNHLITPFRTLSLFLLIKFEDHI